MATDVHETAMNAARDTVKGRTYDPDTAWRYDEDLIEAYLAARPDLQWVPEGGVVVSRLSLEYLWDAASLGTLEWAAKYGPDHKPAIPADVEQALAAAPEPEDGG